LQLNTLMASKGPIQRRQGREKPFRHAQATDDPKKYMGAGEWEQYNEPQGIESAAARRVMHRKKSLSQMVDEELGPLGGFMAPFRGGDGYFAIPDKTSTTDSNLLDRAARAENKRQAKQVRKRVNKTIKRGRSGSSRSVSEMIRFPIFTRISGEYEVKNGETVVGRAHVRDGVVTELVCTTDAGESYKGQILTYLLNTIIEEADRQNSNLSLQLKDKDDDDMKRFLERFGFHAIGHGVMQRSSGAIRPPSVPYPGDMEDREPGS